MRPGMLLIVAVAGGAGAGLRYVIDRLLSTREGGFPFGILAVNVSGSLVLGAVTGLGTAILPELAVVAGVGLLGGYTTFSTVSVETVLLGERRRWRDAAANLLGTLLLSVAAAGVGIWAGSAVASALTG